MGRVAPGLCVCELGLQVEEWFGRVCADADDIRYSPNQVAASGPSEPSAAQTQRMRRMLRAPAAAAKRAYP